MRNLLIAALLSLTTLAPSAFAGGGHSHDPITQEAAGVLAAKKRDQLVAAGKLDKNWGGVAVGSVEQKTFSKGPEWVITFRNDASADPAQRTLYMFYGLDGHYLASNFTGN